MGEPLKTVLRKPFFNPTKHIEKAVADSVGLGMKILERLTKQQVLLDLARQNLSEAATASVHRALKNLHFDGEVLRCMISR